jgi:hypothetical protein
MSSNRNIDRQRAIKRGLKFVHEMAREPENFEVYGYDFLCCFDCIQSTSKDPTLIRIARRMGRERARHWRREHAQLTTDATADDIAALVYGCCAADNLGVVDDGFKKQLSAAAQRFSAEDYLGFDAVNEPPPQDVPDECSCGMFNERGRKRCQACRKSLSMLSHYAVWVDGITRGYHGERYGIRLGAPFVDVLKWLPIMRPYPRYEHDDDPDFYWAIYAVTHVIYTLNDYSFYTLSPGYLPDEYAFLRTNLAHVLKMEDAESMGEILDSLKSFGRANDAALILKGESFLLASQNADGSWGSLSTNDIYQRYHPTWTALDGLREYAWWGGLRSPKQMQKLLPAERS